jgi:hypothetical protein
LIRTVQPASFLPRPWQSPDQSRPGFLHEVDEYGAFTFHISGNQSGLGSATLRDADGNVVDTWQYDSGAIQSVEPSATFDEFAITPHEDNDSSLPQNDQTTISGVIYEENDDYNGLTLEITGDVTMAQQAVSVDEYGAFTFHISGNQSGSGSATLKNADGDVVDTWQYETGAM